MQTNTKIATLVGSRKPPDDISHLAFSIGKKLSDIGVINRTGGAVGMDSDFAKFYNHSLIENYRSSNDQYDCIDVSVFDNYQEAYDLTERIVPHFEQLDHSQRGLHVRNCYQVLGRDLRSPSDILICWCKMSGGVPVGGTRTAITLARMHNVPVFNLYNENSKKLVCEWLKIPYINRFNDLSDFC